MIPASSAARSMTLRARVATLLVVSAVASGAFAAFAAQALATPLPAVTVRLSTPLAVRSGKAFVVRGSASKNASSSEVVEIALQRSSGGTWSTVTTTSGSMNSTLLFSAKVVATKRGHWRALASLEATAGHAAGSTAPRFKVVGGKVIALTFDDGPWPTSTKKIVSTLSKLDVQATFFMLGSQVGGRKALAKSVIAGGNLVGVHSWNHALMSARSSSVNLKDLKRTKAAITAATGVTPTWFRPPYGATNSSLKKTAAKAGLRQVIWTVDTLDWKYRTTSSVSSRALSGARSGAVVLMHDGGGPRAATAAAVPIIIKRLRARGYDFVTLSEMVDLGYKVR